MSALAMTVRQGYKHRRTLSNGVALWHCDGRWRAVRDREIIADYSPPRTGMRMASGHVERDYSLIQGVQPPPTYSDWLALVEAIADA